MICTETRFPCEQLRYLPAGAACLIIMKYVFFDIECASVTKEFAKICVFGYCVTDEQFNIIEKEDVLINPKGGFHLTDRKGREGIVLPYDYEEFKKCPPFPQVYPKIRELLEDENHVVFGHATFNDVKYLNLETRRFRLPALTFSFYDTQLLYMSMTNAFDRQYGLESIVQAMGVDFIPHRAADDAYATMRVAQAMCAREGRPLKEVLEKYGIKAGCTAKGRTVNGSSAAGARDAEERRKRKEAHEKAHIEYCLFIERKNLGKNAREGEFSGKVFTFSRMIEYEPQVVKAYAEEVYRRGGKCSSHVDRCNVYVSGNDVNDRRLQRARESNAEVLSEETFCEKYMQSRAKV